LLAWHQTKLHPGPDQDQQEQQVEEPVRIGPRRRQREQRQPRPPARSAAVVQPLGQQAGSAEQHRRIDEPAAQPVQGRPYHALKDAGDGQQDRAGDQTGAEI
jgi:hypothetical protein